MPRLKIVGCADFIEIDKEKAKTIEEFLYDPDTKSDTMIRVGELSVLKRDIRAIIPDNAVDYERENRYNLSDEKDKAVIKDFEKEFLRFVAEEKEKGKSEDFKRLWMERLGLIKMNRFQDAVVFSKIDEYEEFQRKWEGLQELRIRRSWAERIEKEQTLGVAENLTGGLDKKTEV